MAGAEKLGLLTDLPLEREGGESLKDGGTGMAVRVHGVGHVSHRKRPARPDCQVGPNERVAVVGPPGSGKTTLFEVLCGLREPGHGVVEVDGIDLRGLSLERLREQVALVEGPDLFIGTVSENIRVGRPDLSLTEVREALQAVGLTDVVHALPHGLNTPLTPNGGPLSASQALRLTIARALVGRPRLLILDGALDALDLRECPDLLTRLFDRAAPWTLLVASTNPEVVRLCDRTIDVSGSAQVVPLTREEP
jgi:ABC-type multidrug transport system fused ATPase/permease subunit